MENISIRTDKQREYTEARWTFALGCRNVSINQLHKTFLWIHGSVCKFLRQCKGGGDEGVLTIGIGVLWLNNGYFQFQCRCAWSRWQWKNKLIQSPEYRGEHCELRQEPPEQGARHHPRSRLLVFFSWYPRAPARGGSAMSEPSVYPGGLPRSRLAHKNDYRR